MFRRPSYLPFFLSIIGTLALPAAARAAFEAVAHDVAVVSVNRQTTFTLTFNQPPDFFSTNDLGQPANAFQYFYDSQPTDGEIDFAGDDVVIIRGGEIDIDHTIPIRESLNPAGEDFPNAEGWGPTLGEVDFTVDSATLTFTAGWNLLRESDSHFGYRLYALEHGALTGEITFVTHILIPLPPPLLAEVVLLVLAFLVRCRLWLNSVARFFNALRTPAVR